MNTPVFAKHSLYLYGLYYAETQSNILIIVILPQPVHSPKLSHGIPYIYLYKGPSIALQELGYTVLLNVVITFNHWGLSW